MSRTSKHQSDTPNARQPGPADAVVGGQDVLLEPELGILDEDGGLAIDGGKLPGNHDDFDGEIDHDRPVPGANGPGGVQPPNDRDLRQ